MNLSESFLGSKLFQFKAKYLQITINRKGACSNIFYKPRPLPSGYTKGTNFKAGWLVFW